MNTDDYLAKDPGFSSLTNFADRFTENHVVLAMHAAVPLGLTPEIVHLLRRNFVVRAAWIAEADLLLSPLCREAGDEYYQIQPDIRDMLYQELLLDPEFGIDRIKDIARFLYAYSDRQLNLTANSVQQTFFEVQKLAALAYLDPPSAAEAIAREMQAAQEQENKSDTMRIARITDALSTPLIAEDDVLIYAAGVQYWSDRNFARAKEMFDQLGTGPTVQVGRINLPLPPIEVTKIIKIALLSALKT